jgi:hypothetical protein
VGGLDPSAPGGAVSVRDQKRKAHRTRRLQTAGGHRPCLA